MGSSEWKRFTSPSTMTPLLTLVLLMRIAFSRATHCYDTGNFTSTSNYRKNRDSILSSLPSEVSSNDGFYNTNLGTGDDTVYALSMCRGDVSATMCASCISTAAGNMTRTCPYNKAVFSWGSGDPPCYVRYSDQPIYGILQNQPTFIFYNLANISVDRNELRNIWGNFSIDLAQNASTGSSKLKFATGQVMLLNNPTIYGMSQCTPDLSRSACVLCLDEAINDFSSCCFGHQGGVVYKPSCIFRTESYSFLYDNSSPLPSPAPTNSTSSPLPSPAPTNTTSSPLPSSAPTNTSARGKTKTWIIAAASCGSIVIVIAFVFVLLITSRKQRLPERPTTEGNMDDVSMADSLQFNLDVIRAATNNFSESNKLGQGGFGSVFWGKLPSGQEIAVKRLSQSSVQGELEFKNEVLLLARLQHRNLVRLLGYCFRGVERLLVYEFVPNASLDKFIFDPCKRACLDWNCRYRIIYGIARGLLYLHEDSRLRVIHRDLKASNILLDADMNPKVSDFGMARLFEFDQSQADTRRIAGTYGYMAPEYVMHGYFSLKSDVFSFGVLVLEIVSGQRNSVDHGEEGCEILISHVWMNWREGKIPNIVDPAVISSYGASMIRCIHIGLLCVQQNAANRPTMASVILMLNSQSVTLPVPTKPAFFMGMNSSNDSRSGGNESGSSGSNTGKESINEASITDPYAR